MVEQVGIKFHISSTVKENMNGKNDKNEIKIDMSARSKLKIIAASEYEAEQSQELFQELNNDIYFKMLEFNEKLDAYVEDSLKKTESGKKLSLNGTCNFDKTRSVTDRFVGRKYRMALIVFMLSLSLVGIYIFHFSYNSSVSDILPNATKESENMVILPNVDAPLPTMQYVTPETITETTTLLYSSNLKETIPTLEEDEEDSSDNLTYLSQDIVAKDSISGKEYTREQLANIRLLIPYIEGDKEVYFWGQYNENYRWHGHCVINAYLSDGTLYGIYEYNFQDGKCMNCKSFYRSETEGVWIYLDRQYYDDYKFGESVQYSFQYNNSKNFAISDVEVSDILSVDQFLENSNAVMLKYYYGTMSNGTYNDDSGNAYEIIFDEDGFVYILYVAKFSDGEVNDDKALEIVLDQSDSDYNYFCYSGPIEDSKRKGDVSGQNYVTQNEIDKILKDVGFECNIELKWHQENGN